MNLEPASAESVPCPEKNWVRVLALIFVLAGVAFMTAPPLYAWGRQAHQLADDWAVGTLPANLRNYYQSNRNFILNHANDPEEWMKKDRYEQMRHYIYLNKYGMFPHLELPHSYKAAVDKYGLKHITRNGVLPWQIGEYSLKLTNAFRARDWEQVRLNSAALAFYVAEAHDPLHTTQNYDGQMTGQAGLEMRFGTELVERYSHFFMFRPENAARVNDPTEHAFQMILEANTWVNQIVLADLVAQEGLRGYTDAYFDAFYSRVGSTAMKEISEAAHDIGSYWYSAWFNAGRPELSGH
ncbi:MAG: hypothetical protein EPN47_10505 [Acidobacteria bacterium]|nr:MAG: hypothetical protein EPN47_10505 [Acidobacteriota bacterium]